MIGGSLRLANLVSNLWLAIPRMQRWKAGQCATIPKRHLHNLAHRASLLANETRTAPSRARSHASTLHRRCVATRAHQVEPTARSTRQFFALAIRLTITIH